MRLGEGVGLSGVLFHSVAIIPSERSASFGIAVCKVHITDLCSGWATQTGKAWDGKAFPLPADVALPVPQERQSSWSPILDTQPPPPWSPNLPGSPVRRARAQSTCWPLLASPGLLLMQGGGGGGLHCWDPHPYPGSARSWCIDPTAHGGAGAAGRSTALTSPGRSPSHGRHRCPPGQ